MDFARIMKEHAYEHHTFSNPSLTRTFPLLLVTPSTMLSVNSGAQTSNRRLPSFSLIFGQEIV